MFPEIKFKFKVLFPPFSTETNYSNFEKKIVFFLENYEIKLLDHFFPPIFIFCLNLADIFVL